MLLFPCRAYMRFNTKGSAEVRRFIAVFFAVSLAAAIPVAHAANSCKAATMSRMTPVACVTTCFQRDKTGKCVSYQETGCNVNHGSMR
jgi:hypothetical protein